jgi:hypothetical protein
MPGCAQNTDFKPANVNYISIGYRFAHQAWGPLKVILRVDVFHAHPRSDIPAEFIDRTNTARVRQNLGRALGSVDRDLGVTSAEKGDDPDMVEMSVENEYFADSIFPQSDLGQLP